MRKNVTVEERTQGIQEGVREALREHALLGRSVCILRNEKVVWLTPPEIIEELRRTDSANRNGTASPGSP